MTRSSIFLFLVALLASAGAAQAQTQPATATPAPKGKATPAALTRQATRSDKAYVPSKAIIKDTAEFNRKFRRSGQPADKIRIPVQPK